MSRITVVLAVLVLLVLAQAGQAADLQAGWYARMYSVSYYVHSDYGPILHSGGSFSTTPGIYWPFVLTDDPYHWERSRQVIVPATTFGVDVSSNLLLPVMAGLSSDQPLAYVSFGWETDYDPSQMRLEFWHTRSDGSTERLWQQDQPGAEFGFAYVAYDTTYEYGFFFKAAIVPEPSVLSTLLIGLSGIMVYARRRRSR